MTKSNLKIPKFPKEIRDEILNYTDDKEHKSFIKVCDSDKTYKVIMGAKAVSKSFGYMINTIWRLINEHNYCAVWARNLSKDIGNTVRPTLLKALHFLKIRYSINLIDHFEIYQKYAVFKPTGQTIFFCNFEIVGSFAGLTIENYDFRICDVVFDEIQQNPEELGSDIEKIYQKQPSDIEFIKQSTILRDKREGSQIRSMVFLFNVYDSKHWVCKDYVTSFLPFNSENRQKLLEKNYLLAESDECDSIVMRMSRFYVPKSEIDDRQLLAYEKLKKANPKLYDITIAGEPYDLESTYYTYPFKRFIYDENEKINERFFTRQEVDTNEIEMVVDGYDPGLKDKNGLVRILIMKNLQIIVFFAEEIETKKYAAYKRISSNTFVLATAIALNEELNVESSVMAIDSKEDTILELITKQVQEDNLKIMPCKAIKNHNANFKIDFTIANRVKFLLECFQREIIKFTPRTIKLFEYLSQQAFDPNWKRDEKISPKIYDLINAFEYALSIVYPMFMMTKEMSLKEEYERYTK